MGNERRLLGWFGDDGVAGSQCGCDLAGEDRQREIPRADAGKDAAAIERYLIEFAGRSRQPLRCFEVLGRTLGIVAQEIDGLAQVGLGIVQCLAGFADEERHEAWGIGLIKIGRLFKQAGAGRTALAVPACRGLGGISQRLANALLVRFDDLADLHHAVMRRGYQADRSRFPGLAADQRRHVHRLG